MRRAHLIVAMLLCACAPPLRTAAQALPTALGPGKSVKIGVGYSMYHLQYGQRYLGGLQGWVDASLFRQFGIEAEARRLRQNQDLDTHADTYLIGPRLPLRYGKIEPYVKALVGTGKFNFPYSYAQGSYFVAAGGGGIDLNVRDRIQIRVIDVEYQTWPQFTFGKMSSYGVSAGISFTVFRGTSWRVD